MVASFRGGCAALGFVVWGLLGAAGLASAQPRPISAPDSDLGFIGVPEYASTETGVVFFHKTNAGLVDWKIQKMREAIAACDRKRHNALLSDIIDEPNTKTRFQEYPEKAATATQAERVYDAQSIQDRANLATAAALAPPFPQPCEPPSAGGKGSGGYLPSRTRPLMVSVIGGGVVPLGPSGNVTGVDTFFGSGAYLIDSNAVSGSSGVVALAGLRGRAVADAAAVLGALVGIDPRDPGPHTQLFFETGIQSSFGAQSFIQPFQGVSTTPQGFGTNTVKENFQIPLLLGVGVPINLPIASSSPVLDLYGGITLDSWTHTLQGGEAGAPRGPGFFNQSNRFTVDPTVGAGVRVAIGDLNGDGVPDIIWGVNAEAQFRPGSVATAGSANFPSETYYGTLSPHANLLFMFRVGIPFGGR